MLTTYLMARRRPRILLLVGFLGFAAALAGCTSPLEYIRNGFKVGPNYAKAPVPVAANWIDASDKRVRNAEEDQTLCQWWTVLNDPVLNDLICYAYKQNLTLREAGFRVLQARAQLGIAVGELLPQLQTASGGFSWNGVSQVSRSTFQTQRWFGQYEFGFNLAWELDFWGRFRRAVESAKDTLEFSVEDFDDVLVTLLSDVATNYVTLRTAQERIKYAQDNVKLQEKTAKLVETRKDAGVARQLDVDEARSVLAQTAATVPELEIGLRQSANALCTLLGIPPTDLVAKLGPAPTPVTPPDVAVGIPADLLRRRPDVRKAERLAAAQCAQIGIAEADFYPRISLVGDFGYQAEFIKHLFSEPAFTGAFGPQFSWQILNYGRILNNVRLQDAKFQELVAAYQEAVLNAQQDVENGLVIFLKAQTRTKLQQESVDYAENAVKVVLAQYELGTVDITQLIQIELNLVVQQDTLAVAKGEIPTGLIQVYKALGGGWQLRLTGCEPQGTIALEHRPGEDFLAPSRPKLGAPTNLPTAPFPPLATAVPTPSAAAPPASGSSLPPAASMTPAPVTPAPSATVSQLPPLTSVVPTPPTKTNKGPQ
jgi:NodT family efflux transporter outer membrane factor (OMF) lipoprotein